MAECHHHHRARHLPSTTQVATCPPPPRAPFANHYCASLCVAQAGIRRSTAALRASSYLTIKEQLATCPPPPRAPPADHHHRIARACIFWRSLRASLEKLCKPRCSRMFFFAFRYPKMKKAVPKNGYRFWYQKWVTQLGSRHVA